MLIIAYGFQDQYVYTYSMRPVGNFESHYFDGGDWLEAALYAGEFFGSGTTFTLSISQNDQETCTREAATDFKILSYNILLRNFFMWTQ